MNTKHTILTALVASVALGGLTLTAAEARQGQQRGEGITFEHLDVNGDGVLSMADVAAHQAERFAAIDADGNGAISPEEFANQRDTARAARSQDMVERLDQNGDGQLNAEELADAGPRADGEKRGGGKGKRGGRKGGGRHGNPSERLERLIEQFDIDGDAALSEAEFETAKAAMMERHGKRGKRGDRAGDRDDG